MHNMINTLQKNLLQLEKTILELQQSINTQWLAYKEETEEFRNRFKQVEDWKKGAKVLCDQSKKPHKCPVCEGLRHTISEEGLSLFCEACEGKGVIWG